MRINQVNTLGNIPERPTQKKDVIPETKSNDTIADVEFNIVSDKIRMQNLQNSMNVRLVNLKRSIYPTTSENSYKT